jgi:hypothetical protein
MTVLIAGAVLSIAITGLSAENKVQPKTNAATNPGSNAFGQSFAEWLRDYSSWTYGGPVSQVQPNNVLMLPVPVTPNDAWVIGADGRNIGTAEMDVTVKPGTKLVLAVLGWLGETYDPNLVPPKPDDSRTQFTIADFVPPLGQAVITLDGVELMNDANVASFYYGPISFEPPIMYAAPSPYGSIGLIFVQGIGIIIQPLTPGEHTLKLYSWSYWQGLYGVNGTGWDNTWHITVANPKK